MDHQLTNQPPQFERQLIWHPTCNSFFSVKSAYDLCLRMKGQHQNMVGSSNSISKMQLLWRKTWGLKIKPKFKHFLWKCYHSIMPIVDQLLKRGCPLDGIIKLCGEEIETLEHLFFTCSEAKNFWDISPVRWDGCQQFMNNFVLWWENLCYLDSQFHNQSRLELTAYLLWNWWKNRNNWYFNNSKNFLIEIVEKAQLEW